MHRFIDFREQEKQKKIHKGTLIYSLFGIPVVIFFFISDVFILGIDGTLKWRIIGLVPMFLSFLFYLKAHFFHSENDHIISQWTLSLMIAGVATMMAGIFHIVLINMPKLDPILISGVIAGNLLAIFTIGTLEALSALYVSFFLSIPYLVMVIAFMVSGVLSASQWVLMVNVLAAIPLVLIIIRQREKKDSARLSALYELEEERANLEDAVASRTSELEVLLQDVEKHCFVSVTLNENLVILSLNRDFIASKSSYNYNFAILLSELINAELSTENIDSKTITRLSMPLNE